MLSDWYQIQKLANTLYGIGEFKHLEEVISFLLIGDDEAVLFDSGLGLYSIKEVVSNLTTKPCRILNTHSHFDHVGSNAEFSDLAIFDHPRCREVALSGFTNSYLAEWTTAEQFFGKPPEISKNYSIKAFPWTKFFTERDTFSISPFNFEVLHTPGHSDDSVCFYEQEQGWLFAGDLVYDGPIYIESIGGLQKYRHSIDRLIALKKLTRIFCCHNSYEFTINQLHRLKEVLDQIKTIELENEVKIEGRLRLLPC